MRIETIEVGEKLSSNHQVYPLQVFARPNRFFKACGNLRERTNWGKSSSEFCEFKKFRNI